MARKPTDRRQRSLFSSDPGDLPEPKTAVLFNPKETTMQYKTIIHELLQQRPRCTSNSARAASSCRHWRQYAQELKTSHEAWKEMLLQLRPGSDPTRSASEAMELALKEMEDRLPSASPQDGSEPQFLDAAMLFLRRPMSRA